MATEIERKFLVRDDAWRGLATGIACRQGYLSTVRGRTVRVRTMGGRGFLTVKGFSTGASRPEYEYEIPVADATALLAMCEQPLVEKVRYRIPRGDVVWEIDEFEGVNRGLVVAEIELAAENQAFALPEWIGAEVTGDPRYYNSSLVARPFSIW